MSLQSPVVFPLFHIVQTPSGPECGCGTPGCGRIGKHPRIAWGDLKLGDQVPKPEPGAGAGIKTGAAPYGSNIIVVDLDSEEAYDLFDELGGSAPTRQVFTPRGYHLYFKHPGFPVRNSAGELGKGIDIRGERGFVVAPGSPHASGSSYRIAREHDIDPIDAPEWLVKWLKERPHRAVVGEHVDDVTDPVERKRRQEMYAKWLANEAPRRGPERRGQGDKTLYEVVQVGAYDLALPTNDVLELIRKHYDPRCDPMWGDELEERVLYKADYAKNNSTRVRRPPMNLDEEAIWASAIEPTALTSPKERQNDGYFGFKIRRGGWDQIPVPPKYLVDELFLESKVNMIFADPGSIKTWTAIDIAACVSAGLPWLAERPTTQALTLYVDFEDGEHEFHRRVSLLTGGHDRPSLWYAYNPGTLVEEAFWNRLTSLTKQHNIKFVVLDTLSAGSPGVDENDRNAAAPITRAGDFTEATGATVLFLHHANRSGSIRGTSAFTAAVDTLFKLDTLTDVDGVHRAKLTCTKSGQKKVLPFSLEFTDEGLRRYSEPAKSSDDSKDEKKDRRSLHDLKAEVLLNIESHGPIASVQMIREMVKARATNVSAVIAELEAAGDIVKTSDGWCRDTEQLRRERLRETVRENPDWSRGKVVSHANVSLDYFEQCRAKGWLAARSPDPAVVGFVWTHST